MTLWWLLLATATNACLWKTKHLTWYSDDEDAGTIAQAFHFWQKDTDFEFKQIQNPETADIMIDRNMTSGDRWSTALHVIGHILGLDDVLDDNTSVMAVYPNHTIIQRSRQFLLPAKDIQTLQDVYLCAPVGIKAMGQVDECSFRILYDTKSVTWNHCNETRTTTHRHFDATVAFHFNVTVTFGDDVYIENKWKANLALLDMRNVRAVAMFKPGVLTFIYGLDTLFCGNFYFDGAFFPSTRHITMAFDYVPPIIVGAGKVGHHNDTAALYDDDGKTYIYRWQEDMWRLQRIESLIPELSCDMAICPRRIVQKNAGYDGIYIGIAITAALVAGASVARKLYLRSRVLN